MSDVAPRDYPPTPRIPLDVLYEREFQRFFLYDQSCLAFKARAIRMGLAGPGLDVAMRKAWAGAKKLAACCESPIEREMALPLVMADYDGLLTIPPVVFNPAEDDLCPPGDVVIMPQLQLGRYRLDFAVIAEVERGRCVFAVECDGLRFHQDKMADLRRQACLESMGVRFVRAWGREIRDDPHEIARRVASAVTAWHREATA